MAATHNYYRILGVPSTAGVPEIRNAVSALRTRDAAGSYTATLNTIEETLSDPQKRNAYDDQLGLTAGLRGDYYVAIQAQAEPKKQTFVDVTGREYGSEEALRNAQQARYNQMAAELEDWEKGLAARDHLLSSGRAMLFLGMLAMALAIAFFSGKPFYDDYRAKQQSEEAYVALSNAGNEVMSLIRSNKVFPSSYSNDGEYYHIGVEGDNAIKLSFNQNAYNGLQGSSITFELYQIPNAGVDWRCRTDLPEDYVPVRCPK